MRTRNWFAILLLVGGSLWGTLFLADSTSGQMGTSADGDVTVLSKKIDTFFNSVSSEQVEVGYKDLLAGTLLEKKAEAVKNLVDRTKELESRFGKFISSEEIGVEKIGKDVIVLKYLYKCDQFPIMWYFTYYRVPMKDKDKNVTPTVSVTVDQVGGIRHKGNISSIG